jgi:hypothetical protein
MLDPARLEKVRKRRGKVVCACPACRESGGDGAGEHLAVFESGAFHCAVDESEAHRKRIFELAGVHSPAPLPFARRPVAAKPVCRPAPALPRLPELRPLKVAEMARIAAHRGWPLFAGLELLSRRGLLWFGRVWDGGAEHDAWIVTDSTRRNAQARRIDGQPWQCGKAKTLPGADAGWPVGAGESRDYPHIMLCEGGPDFLAALLVAWWHGYAGKVAPVAILGAGLSLPADALRYFTGKEITICQHADTAHTKGQDAASRWAAQLRGAGAASIRFTDFSQARMADGRPCKDLADFATTLRLPEPEQPAIA